MMLSLTESVVFVMGYSFSLVATICPVQGWANFNESIAYFTGLDVDDIILLEQDVFIIPILCAVCIGLYHKTRNKIY